MLGLLSRPDWCRLGSHPRFCAPWKTATMSTLSSSGWGQRRRLTAIGASSHAFVPKEGSDLFVGGVARTRRIEAASDLLSLFRGELDRGWPVHQSQQHLCCLVLTITRQLLELRNRSLQQLGHRVMLSGSAPSSGPGRVPPAPPSAPTPRGDAHRTSARRTQTVDAAGTRFPVSEPRLSEHPDINSRALEDCP